MALQAVYDAREVDAGLAGVCGAYCGACPVYRAWVEQDTARLEAFARSLGVPTAGVICTGCRTPEAFCFGGDCEIKRCARNRGIVFCADCDAYPCERIHRKQGSAVSRASMCRDAARIGEVGVYRWLVEQDVKWRCPSCGAKVAAGDTTCGACEHALPNL
jgi:hypothetical protein